MIFKQETQILKCTFEKEHFSKVKAAFKDRWPVVYIIEDDEKGQAYIGESTNICTRICDHWNNTERRALKNIYIIFNKVFNKSVILDLEAFLIGYIVADGKYRLQNGNGGQHVHNYYLRDEYQREFRHIWQLLQDEGVVRHGITLLENQDLFKYSPYKILNLDQFNVAVQILTDLKSDLGNNNQSRSFIIDGGAGTGKSILGIYLLKLLIDAKSSPAWTAEEEALDENLSYIIGHLSPDLRVGYVVPTQSFRETLKKVFDGIQGLDSKMVLSPEDVANSGEGLYDLLIVDESHRLRRRRALFNYGSYDKANEALELDKEATELDWILEKSWYQLFFYDSRQSVKPSDVEALRFFSLSRQEDTRNYKLTSQMRCKGGNDYIDYIPNIPKGYVKWYEWAYKPEGIKQVGCIYTAQGFEFDYIGVIIGPDLRYDTEQQCLITDIKEIKDPMLKRNAAYFDNYARNIYRVLMSRGMKGCYVYCCDENLKEYLRAKIRDRK